MNRTGFASSFGPITFFGSGETLPASGKAYELIAGLLNEPPRLSILETPAGFQPNASLVAQKVADFIEVRLQNFAPRVTLIPARRKDGQFSTNDPEILKPLMDANWIFLGPGSPTYTVDHIKASKLLQYLYASHASGSALTFSSAAVLAMSAFTLPVYEIYKVGDDLHWARGLNFLSTFGLDFIFIPHWDNNSGGEELDTRRCYMGLERFIQLRQLLPLEMPIIGIDEQTALTITFSDDPRWIITGNGTVTIQKAGQEISLGEGEYDSAQFGLAPTIPDRLPAQISNLRSHILSARAEPPEQPSDEVIQMAEDRLSARKSGDWDSADQLRDQINDLGWDIQDTGEGFNLTRK